MGYLILLLILVAIIVYFWSYVKIILGVVGIITILKSLILIFSDDDDVKPTGIIFLIIGLALAIFFIFVPYWNVCKWILLGLGILAVMILVIVDIESRNEEKEKERKRLEKEHQKKLEQERLERKRLERKRVQSKLESTFEGTFLPIPEKLSETHNLAHIKSLLKEYNQLNKTIKDSSSEDFEKTKKSLFDTQLSLFYELNIFPESTVKDFFKQPSLRKDIDEENILKGKSEVFKIISDLELRLKKITTPNVDTRLKQIENMDTSGVIGTSIEKLTEQTKEYKILENELLKIVKDLDEIRNKVNKEVTKVRLVAYRNVYLAREVVSFYLSKGKTKEDMEKSLFKIDISKLKTSYLDISNLQMDYDNVTGGALVGLQAANTLRSSGVRVGKKATIGLAAAGALVAAYQEREQKKEANRTQQLNLIKNIDKITCSITEERTAIKSTIELVEKITNVNINLYREYVQLRDRVFNGDAELSKNDFMHLIKLVNAFNEIRNDKLIN